MAELGLEPTRPPSDPEGSTVCAMDAVLAPSAPLCAYSLVPLALRDGQALDSTSQGLLLCLASLQAPCQGRAFLLRPQGSHEKPRWPLPTDPKEQGPLCPQCLTTVPPAVIRAKPFLESRSTADSPHSVPCAHLEVSWPWDRLGGPRRINRAPSLRQVLF